MLVNETTMMSSGPNGRDPPDVTGVGTIPTKNQKLRENNEDSQQEKKSPMTITSDEVNFLIFR